MSKQGKFSVESRVQQMNGDKKARDQADPKWKSEKTLVPFQLHWFMFLFIWQTFSKHQFIVGNLLGVKNLMMSKMWL